MPETLNEPAALLALLRVLNARLDAVLNLEVAAMRDGISAKTTPREKRQLIEQLETIVAKLEALHA